MGHERETDIQQLSHSAFAIVQVQKSHSTNTGNLSWNWIEEIVHRKINHKNVSWTDLEGKWYLLG